MIINELKSICNEGQMSYYEEKSKTTTMAATVGFDLSCGQQAFVHY